MSEVINKLGINLGDNKVHYTFRENKKRFGLTFGQKYGVMIEIKKRQLSFGHFDTINPSDNWWIEVNSIQDLLDAKSIIIDSAIEEYSKTSKSGYKKHSSKVLERSILDPNYRDELFTKAFNTKTNQSNMNTQDSIDLNQIFFGPPGTGKTFHTINEAIKIVDPEFYKIHKNDREQLKARFKLLSLNNDNESVGQIGFTTFHQSFSYEDFIEGIKPNEPKEGDAFLKYEIQEGVFKKICRLAADSLNAVAVDTESLISLSTEEYEKAHFYKMSLGNTQDESDNEIYEYCIENNCISIGFGNQLDFTGKDEKELRSFGNDNDLDSFSIQAMNLFSNYLKIGNYVDEGARVIRISDFDELGFKNHKVVRHNYTDDLLPYVLEDRNILIAMTGGTVGKSLFVNHVNETMVVNQRVATIKIIQPIFEAYVNCVIPTKLIQDVIEEAKNSTNDNISMSDIKGFNIPIPPLEEQKVIVEVVNALFKEVEALENLTKDLISLKEDFVTSALRRLTETDNTKQEWNYLQQHFSSFFTEKKNIKSLRETILQLAVQGKLTAQWRADNPNTEPASELLKRIEAEKQQLIAEKKIKAEK